jgi:hypothetical protein
LSPDKSLNKIVLLSQSILARRSLHFRHRTPHVQNRC